MRYHVMRHDGDGKASVMACRNSPEAAHCICTTHQAGDPHHTYWVETTHQCSCSPR